jgi:hypothetical protein
MATKHTSPKQTHFIQAFLTNKNFVDQQISVEVAEAVAG